jgi:RHS repeat-associated protein
MGNVKSIQLDDGLTVMNSDFRGPGRPNTRDLSLPTASSSPKILRRKYAYRDIPGDTGQLQEMRAIVFDPATNASVVVAGSRVGYNGLQVNDAQLLGVSSGQRHSAYTYDDRGRLAGFITAAGSAALPSPHGADPKAPGAAAELPDDADFREMQVRVPALDATTTNILSNRGINVASIDPAGMTATPLPGHKIGTVTPAGGPTRTLDYGGKSELIDDGIFLYSYDVKGRLVWTMEKPTTAGATIRRILYVYDSRNRLAGRTAEAANVPAIPVTDVGALAWQTETRAGVLAEDGLPAETTFIWDPVADRLMTIVRAGASFVNNDPNANIVKQFIHGEMGYDDPIQISMIDASAPHAPGDPAPVKKLYPVYDEAAGGSLQVVLNDKGEVVARSITTDPYGGARFDLSAGAIDHIEITGSKDNGGTLQSVKVAMRSTEQLALPSLTTGTRLAIVDASGTVLRTSSATPTLDPNDPFTVTWTIPGADWNTFSDPSPVAVGGTTHTPAALSIAATSTLRASVWSAETPFLPAPAWATASRPVYSSSALPIEVRESLTNVSALITSLQPGETRTDVSYDIPNLSLTGSQAGDPNVAALFASSFQAQPFTEPFTHKIYVRERWYDPVLGMWLTPDPLGYRDSSNLYAFAGGDQVNGRDPTGMWDWDPAAVGHAIKKGASWVKQQVNDAMQPATTGIKVVDSVNQVAGAVVSAHINTAVDLAAGFVAGAFTIGEGTGTAIGAYDSRHKLKSVGKVALHGTLDSVAVVAYGTGLYGLAQTGLARVGLTLAAEEAGALTSAPLRSAAASGLPEASPEQLKLVVDNLRRQGVEVSVGDEAAARALSEHGGNAQFWADANSPGRMYLKGEPTRLELFEETMHWAQHRRNGFISDQSLRGGAVTEIEANQELVRLGDKLGWTFEETNAAQSRIYSETEKLQLIEWLLKSGGL